jgi:ornithine decarboxylase
MANADALCTRIIGVKQNASDSMHFYIDDGCYGGLYDSTGEARVPLPLRTRDDENRNNNHHDESPSKLLKATVWGPTCDGLDKVCQDIELPVLERDDWLVFLNLGFCNVGTAFNVFAPPDTAYCVLGGYLHRGLED